MKLRQLSVNLSCSFSVRGRFRLNTVLSISLFVLQFGFSSNEAKCQTSLLTTAGTVTWTAATWSPAGTPDGVGVAIGRSANGNISSLTVDSVRTVGSITYTTTSNNSWTITPTFLLTLDETGAGTVNITNSNTSTGASNALVLAAGTDGILLNDNLLITNNAPSTSSTSNGAIQILSKLSGTNINITTNNVNNIDISTGTLTGSIRVTNAASNFTGTVLIQKGTTTFANNQAFGNVAGNTITIGQNGFGNAALISTTSSGVNLPNDIVIASVPGATVVLGSTSSASSSSLTYSGTVLLNGDVNIFALQTGTGFTILSGSVSGAGSLKKVGIGQAQLSSGNSYMGGTTISEGTLIFSNGNPNLTGGITIASGATLQWGNGSTSGSTQAITSLVNNGAIIVNRSNAGPVNGDTTSGVGTPITGTGTFTKLGVIAWGMNPLSTYSGATLVSNGSLLNSDTNSFSPNSDVTVNSPGILSMNGFGGVIRSLSGTGIVNNSGANNGTPTLTIGSGTTTATSTTFAGVIADNVNRMAVAKAGPSTFTQVFSGSNTYSSITTITSGTLQMGHANALGFGGFTPQGFINSVGTTTVTAFAVLDLSGQTNINEVITLNGTGIGNTGALINSSATPASIGSGIAYIALASSTSGGSGYNPTATTVSIAGNATATLQFGVTRVTIDNAGSGYTGSASATLTGATGTISATLTVSVDDPTDTIDSIAINRSGGYGYTGALAPLVTITGAGGSGATATAFIGVTGVPLTSAGSGYTSVPAVTITGSNTTAATATAVLTEIRLGTTSPSIGGTGDITINARITGTTGFTKVGSNTLTLAGANPYSGGTTVSEGTLLVANTTGSGTGTGSVTTSGTSILRGTGTITGNVTIGDTTNPATLAAGTAAALGTLTISGATTLSLANNSNVFWRLRGAPGSYTQDQVVLASGASIPTDTVGTGVTLTLDLQGVDYDALKADIGVGNSRLYTLFANTTTTQVNAPTIVLQNAVGFSLSEFGIASNGVNVTFTPLPEPALLGFLGLAAVGLIRRRR